MNYPITALRNYKNIIMSSTIEFDGVRMPESLYNLITIYWEDQVGDFILNLKKMNEKEINKVIRKISYNLKVWYLNKDKNKGGSYDLKKDKKNLISRLDEGEISLVDLISMDSYEMSTSKQDCDREASRKRGRDERDRSAVKKCRI